jgi:trehalose-6-phosphate synthase
MWDKETLLQTVQTQFKDHLLVTVSSRQPYGHVMKDGHVVCIRQPGGLVSALDPVMQAVKGLWIAVGDQRYDRQNVDVEGKVKVPPENPSYDLKRIWLSKEEMDQYYFGYANQALWPLCHISYTRPEFSSTDWEGYERVNKKFADAILEGIGDRPAFIWLQDYHLTRVAYYLRKAKRKQKTVIALFWHIPWPNQEVFRICPQRKKILEGLLSTDLIGFHTQYHCTHFLDTVDQELESRIDRERQMITFHKHKTSVRAFPISIDFKRVNALASSADVRKRTKRLSERFDVGTSR